jgi:hypothetical protein
LHDGCIAEHTNPAPPVRAQKSLATANVAVDHVLNHRLEWGFGHGESGRR